MEEDGGDVIFPQTPLAFVIAGISSFTAIVIAVFNTTKHLQHYTNPYYQKSIVRILIIIPLYATGSFISLTAPKAAIYVDTVRDVYEAYVIYMFLNLCLAYAGGDANCVAKIAQDPGEIRHPMPFCWMAPIPVGGRFLRWCKQGTLQFVVTKPIFAVLSITMLAFGLYDSKGYQAVLLVVYNVSYTLALYMLLLFYIATRELLKNYQPVRKFFAVKSIVFMTYWQALAVSLLPGLSREDSNHWNDFILCCEFTIFAIISALAFPYTEFKDASMPSASILANVTEVLSVKDVVQDTVHNFRPAYQDYVLAAGPDNKTPPRTIRTKTYLAGNLGDIEDGEEHNHKNGLVAGAASMGGDTESSESEGGSSTAVSGGVRNGVLPDTDSSSSGDVRVRKDSVASSVASGYRSRTGSMLDPI